ncbi:uncharacterized protein FMAN_07940 [Fusarium mangiferae]|uniref:Uncharacterized protein n=1 Tax=Fusarium mangiferae TaxID=192010 RepID=A0A1L7TY03_FUSMA|nr:uncharacterized protein FMAN_07940 [Fusarium mangiferae]CVL01762.1 uncharacterized protein FMAN_07940 [Fusarium mangiferae]
MNIILMFSKHVVGVVLAFGQLPAGTGQQDEYDISERSRPIIEHLLLVNEMLRLYKGKDAILLDELNRALTVHPSDRHSTRVKRKWKTDCSS